MRLTPWESKMDEMLSRLEGCEWPLIRITFPVLAREFYRVTRSWRHTPDPIYVQPGIADYEVSDVRDVNVIAVDDIKIDGKRIYDTQYRDPDAFMLERVTTRGSLQHLSFHEGQLWMNPVPVAAGTFTLRLFLEPLDSCAGIPTHLAPLHMDIIAAGVLADLKMMSGKPWSDPQGAVYPRTKFERGLGRARIAAERGGLPRVERNKPFWW